MLCRLLPNMLQRRFRLQGPAFLDTSPEQLAHLHLPVPVLWDRGLLRLLPQLLAVLEGLLLPPSILFLEIIFRKLDRLQEIRKLLMHR